MKDVQPVHLALFVIFVLSWCGSLYSLYSAARRRRSGVSFSTASNFLLLCLRPDLYTQEGLRARRRTLVSFAVGMATIVTIVVLKAAGLGTL
jgi:hypothetical protein